MAQSNLRADVRDRLASLSEKLIILNRISRDLNTLDLDLIAQIVADRFSALLEVEYCSLYLYDYENNTLHLQDKTHENSISRRIFVSEHPNSIMAHALVNKKIVHIRNIEEYQKANGIKFEKKEITKYKTKSCVCAPLMAGSYTVGILNVADKVDGSPFDELNDLPLIEQFSQVVAMAIRNCRLFAEVQKQASTDDRTGLANYRAFHERMESEISRAERYKRPLSLIMLDLDNFKQINDQYGHTIGDLILTALCKAILASVRRDDVPARYGGDEITIILPETDLRGAALAAERILTIINNFTYNFDIHSIPLTVSIGVAGYEKGMTFSQFVDTADQALYKAKRAGKNRVVVADQPT